MIGVHLTKLSLWLATLAKDHPFTFLDHAIRCGDSLVGLTRRQIETFTWKTGSTTGQLWEPEVRKRTAAALRERQNLLGLGDDDATPQLKRERLEKADELLDLARFIGDAAVAAFFAADKDKAREAKRAELAERIADYLGKGDLKLRPTDEVKALRGGHFTVMPFHWEIEFPEVFERENSGFDGFVGNPPFLGGSQLSQLFRGPQYQEWLKAIHILAFGNADLAAYFFRRAFSLIRDRGTMGFLATKTISEGETRTTGLQAIVGFGGQIYNAVRSEQWPGEATVSVVVVHIAKNAEMRAERPTLDGEHVETINSRLHPNAELPDPVTLSSNDLRGFRGADLGGSGFILSPDEYARLAANSQNAPCILPFLGGEELNRTPTQSHERFAICFGSESLEYAERFPELLSIVRARVKPERDKALDHGPGKHGKKFWWQFTLRADPLHLSIRHLPRCLVTARTTAHLAFSFQPIRQVFPESTVAIAFDSFGAFACIQSTPHSLWAFLLSSFMGETLRYSVSGAFQTFPFPSGFETNAALEAAGRVYYEFRATLMQDLWLGLTEIYNLFHSPDDEALARLEAIYRKRAATPDWRTAESVPADRSPLALYATPAAALAGVRRLRELHVAMDTAVLTAYGWADLLPKCTCEFLLDYEDDDSESAAEEFGGRKKKKPWRYRWPDEIRDEVLARLLKLNAERAEEERSAGARALLAEKDAPLTGKKPSVGTHRGRKTQSKSAGVVPAQTEFLPPAQGDFFDPRS